MKNESPPRWFDSLLDKLAPPSLAEEIKGDLYEIFCDDLSTKGITRSKLNYIFNGLGFLTKSFFWKKHSSHLNNTIMLNSYFKMARRSLQAYKSNTVINILGLVIGIASALVIFSVIRYELSFDSFHSDADKIYRMVRVSGTNMTILESSECRTGVSFPVPNALREESSALTKITAVLYNGDALIEVPDKSGAITRRFQENSTALVEPSFFSIFDFKNTNFKWYEGSPKTSLEKPFSIVLTKSASAKYFPDGNAMGMTLKIDKKFDCTITGIIEDFPSNCDFPFTVLISYSSLNAANSRMMSDWYSVDDTNYTFVVPAPGLTVDEVQKDIARVHASHTPKDLHESRYYLLQPLSEMHFDPRFGTFGGRTITRQTLLALGIVALFLLLTGSINYINLATAQSTMRSKEIGLRKVMGSNRKNLMVQFLTETFLVVLMAGVFALGLSELLLFRFQSLLNIKPETFYFADPVVLMALSIIIIFVTLFAGIYPSFLISKFNPVTALKNRFTTETVGGFSLRKVLVVAQFTITQMLVIGTFVVVAQMNFFQTTEIGFVHDAIINISVPERDPVKRETMSQQLKAQPFVSDVSLSFSLPGGVNRNRSYQDIRRTDAKTRDDIKVFEFHSIDPSFLDLYKIKLLAGRNFTSLDSAPYILINKSLMNNLQLGTPEAAVGSSLHVNENKYMVIGVIDDFYSNSLKSSVDNMAMVMDPNMFRKVSIKLALQDGSSLPDAVEKIKKIWTTTYPDYIFDYQFLDENIKAFYEQEQKYAQLFQLFSFIFLLIGCLGLFGLITFVVNRKGKEIAVRKVLGASVSGLLFMFSKEYVKLILISFVLAIPVTYYVVNNWLSNFSHHIELQWWLFVSPGFIVLLIAILVVCAKSIGAANRNPVDSLKCE